MSGLCSHVCSLLSAFPSICPSCWDKKRWKGDDSSAASERTGGESSCRDGEKQSRQEVRAGVNSSSWTTSWIFFFIGCGGLSFATCQWSTYNQTSSITGTPLWVLFWNSLIWPGAMKAHFKCIQSQKMAFLLFRPGIADREYFSCMYTSVFFLIYWAYSFSRIKEPRICLFDRHYIHTPTFRSFNVWRIFYKDRIKLFRPIKNEGGVSKFTASHVQLF